ncbi:hypothetical protein [Streptomyces ardesiacus]|uniref:hypothetical protein n=1 Tax=Streptomyces ardesiacus TaxID=285564 RepID=UPI0036E446CD
MANPTPAFSIRTSEPAWRENSDGVWTWHPEPHVNRIYEPFNDHQLRTHGAYHEAGHTIAALTAGLTVDAIHLAPSGQGDMFHSVISGTIFRWTHYVTMLAAGERAADRWLRESGLWTEERAWSVERGARTDRATAIAFAAKHGEQLTLTAHPWDGWTQICSYADGRLNTHWERVVRLADALAQNGSLDASAIQDVTELPASPEGRR